MLLVLKPKLINSICFCCESLCESLQKQICSQRTWLPSSAALKRTSNSWELTISYSKFSRVPNRNSRPEREPAARTYRATSSGIPKLSTDRLSLVATLETGLLPAGSRWNSMTPAFRLFHSLVLSLSVEWLSQLLWLHSVSFSPCFLAVLHIFNQSAFITACCSCSNMAVSFPRLCLIYPC